MGLKQAKGNSYIWAGVWKEKRGWAWKIEDRNRWKTWGGSGFQSRDAAKENMDEVLRGLKVEL
jgi:hypothetical protein